MSKTHSNYSMFMALTGLVLLTQAQANTLISANAVTVTTVYSSVNPSTAGTPTLSANVSSATAATPLGTVSFSSNGKAIPGCSAEPLNAGVANCTVPAVVLADGANLITAAYIPAANSGFNASVSPQFTQYRVASLTQATVPGAPYDVLVAPGNGQVTLSWFPPANTGGQNLRGYQVQYGVTGSPPYATAGCTTSGALSCVVTGLGNNKPYTFTVSAGNSSGSGPLAYSSSVVPTDSLAVNPSHLALSARSGGALIGNPRVIVLTNNSSTEITSLAINYPDSWTGDSEPSATSSCTSVLPQGASCAISVTPGTSATSNCTKGSAPASDTIRITSSAPITTVAVDVLGYGCQYQQGFVFSIDDNTPLTGSMGGKVAALIDQAEPYILSGPQSNSVIWSSNGDIGGSIVDYTRIWGAGAVSDFAHPDPNTASSEPAIYHSGQQNCNGATDGFCNSGNVLNYYNNDAPIHPVRLNYYAAGLCNQTIDGYSDWYLPAICEMDAVYHYINCPSGSQSMVSSLAFLVGNPGARTPNISCSPPRGSYCLAGVYWSSSEASIATQHLAWGEQFSTAGNNQGYADEGDRMGVRCSRALTL